MNYLLNEFFQKRKTNLLQHLKALTLVFVIACMALPLSAQSYLTGDFHQHTTYTDGSYTIGYMMLKNNQYGLNWWANSEHGGGFTTNARVTGKDNNNTTVYWDSYTPNPIIGTSVLSGGHQVMWRWQMLRDSSFTQILKARSLYPTKTILQSYEMNVPGHEHGSMGLITNQFQTTPNCNPLAQFEFMFDGSDADLTGGVLQGWTKSKASGHAKTIEALTWLQTYYPTTSYVVPAHPERKQPTSGGYSIAAFRDMNNAAPNICFGFESMPGHQKDSVSGRGGYTTSAVGGGTFGGTGYFSAKVGGLWDAMLSEGRNFWLFANSDCHDEAGDFYPGEYQKNYTFTTGKTAQNIVDGLRSGNTWVVEGDLIDSLIYNVETIGTTEKISMPIGSKLMIEKGKSVKITIKARDPQGVNFNTYSSYTNPVLNHIDLIKGKVTGKISPADAKYNVDTVATTSVIARFDATGGVIDSKNITSTQWTSTGNGWVEMSYTVSNVTDSMYFRLRGSNLALNVANETDGAGNPLADTKMGKNNATKAFADLWFYSNPIFVYSVPVKTADNSQIQMIYTSDSHYGITRANFQGAATVNAQAVNQALVAKINQMPNVMFPSDNGLNAGQTIGAIDYVINTGDIANRQEAPIQSAAASWIQFQNDYINGITLKNKKNQNATLLLAPGNHDVSNAIGYYKAMTPAIDKTSMVNIYNMMMNPTTPKTTTDYNYTTDKVNYSKNIGGVHFMFVTLWPDSTNRKWMDTDLANVSSKTPVVIFTHDQPDIEMKHLRNPNPGNTINSTNKFENMVEEVCKDALTASSAPSTIEQRGFANWVKAHPNVKAYFHGNSNWNQFYTYTGPDNNIALKTFRVDSPMKGEPSATNEKILSYQVISLDSISKNMTVRECLWNPTSTAGAPVQWGASTTIALSKGDSLINVAKGLTESNYSIPSWTLLKRYANLATKLRTDSSATAFSLRDSSVTVALQNALNGLKAKEIPYSVNMTFNGSPATQMGFAWYTNKGIDKGKVQIVAGKKTSDDGAFATPLFTFVADTTNVTTNYCVSSNGLLALTGIANNSVRSYSSHKALATGLTPNTTYSYRVGIDGGWSEVGSFTTAKNTKEPFSFMYFTDSQANTDDMFTVSAKTTHAAKALFPNSNFALSCGDLVETSGSTNAEWEYEQFFQTQQDIWNTTPFVAVIGNHDNTSNKNFTKHFNTSSPNFDKTMSSVPGSIYSFVYGDALFMAIQHEDYTKTGMMDSVKTWMQKQVAANPTVKWRIAFFHKTMYTGSYSHQSDADGKAIREFFTPVFDDLKIDLALEGHDHCYEVMGPLKAKALVPNAVSNQTTSTPIFDVTTTNNNANVNGKNGGTFDVKTGTLYFLNNSAGEKKYRPRVQSEMDASAVVTATGITGYFNFFTGKFGQTGEPTFSNVIVSTDSICIATYTVNKTTNVATLYDNFKIIKGNITAVNSVNSEDASVIVYPIPAQTEIAISGLESVDKMELFDLGGKKVVSVMNDNKMSVASLKNGVYLLKINSNEKQLIRKVTINK